MKGLAFENLYLVEGRVGIAIVAIHVNFAALKVHLKMLVPNGI